MMVTDVIARLSSLGAYLHSPTSTEQEGKRECRILLTCSWYTVEGTGSSWSEAVEDALAQFEADPLPPWPFLDVIDVGEAGC